MRDEHDGKLNNELTDEEIERLYLEAMSEEVPDLWDRIEAGIEDETPSNVVSFTPKENIYTATAPMPAEAPMPAGGEAEKRKPALKKFIGTLAAAAVIILVGIPMGKLMFSRSSSSGTAMKSESSEASDSANKDAYAESEGDMYEAAADECTEACEAPEADNAIKNEAIDSASHVEGYRGSDKIPVAGSASEEAGTVFTVSAKIAERDGRFFLCEAELVEAEDADRVGEYLKTFQELEILDISGNSEASNLTENNGEIVTVKLINYDNLSSDKVAFFEDK